ncbi:hypothetical protein NITHO_3530002 [Nitrolancea hollandica Lb]|uniref:SWIM-type domain-containing protein n=1 Tax=Nitrolancea hollandica Lb TaxID=1129897 RepID=I4EIK9_9BACT|nr:hypothetical protein NITHO_3530002 [Nitrolancea hollandica Lb]
MSGLRSASSTSIIQSKTFVDHVQVEAFNLSSATFGDNNWVFVFFHKHGVTATYTIKRPAKVLKETTDVIEIGLRRSGANAVDELLSLAHCHTSMVLPVVPKVNRCACGVIAITGIPCSHGIRSRNLLIDTHVTTLELDHNSA